MTDILNIENLVKEYPGHPNAVDGIDLIASEGEFLTLLGPSGCGKTTTLRCVAGLETPTAGTVRIRDSEVFGPHQVVPTHRRNIAMVFQSYAIWPHMTVLENVLFPLNKLPKSEGRERARQALAMVDLERFGDRPATALSGGQQQRVAFARAVVRHADLLLLDEPLSNLDAALRVQMRREMRELQRRLAATTIYVTHDQEEALSLSDRIAVMHAGKIVEIGAPEELYLRPTTAFTAQFIGQAQLWDAQTPDRDGRVLTPIGPLRVARPVAGSDLKLLVRPEHFTIVHGDDDQPNSVPGRVRSSVFSGKLLDLEIEVADQVIRVQELSGLPRRAGNPVRLVVDPERCVLVHGTDRDVQAAREAAQPTAIEPEPSQPSGADPAGDPDIRISAPPGAHVPKEPLP